MSCFGYAQVQGIGNITEEDVDIPILDIDVDEEPERFAEINEQSKAEEISTEPFDQGQVTSPTSSDWDFIYGHDKARVSEARSDDPLVREVEAQFELVEGRQDEIAGEDSDPSTNYDMRTSSDEREDSPEPEVPIPRSDIPSDRREKAKAATDADAEGDLDEPEGAESDTNEAMQSEMENNGAGK